MSIEKSIFDSSNYCNSPVITFAGYVKCDDGWDCSFHSHNCAEIMFCTKGSGIVKIDDQEYPVKEGDVVIFNPNIKNKSSDKGDKNFEFFFLGVDHFIYPPFPKNTIMPDCNPILPMGANKNQLITYFTELLYEASKCEFHYNIAMSNIASLIILFIIRIAISNTSSQFEAETQNPLALYSLKIKSYIDINYNTPINMDTLADTFYISKSYISHIFKNDIGVSPIEYLINKRISIAKHLITTTKLSISDIAAYVGYENPLYFSQIFKRSTSYSPTQFRLESKKQI